MHIASNTSSSVEYYHVDHLGSTRLKTNSTGGVIYKSNYEPFGPSAGESGTEDYRYTGKPEDLTGLYYFGARYYDTDVSRFITRDPVSGRPTDPQTLNKYVYCRNNPIKYTDPDGKLWNILGGAALGAVINSAFYLMELGVTGKEYNRNDLIATAAAGAVSGAIAGATFGAGCIPASGIGKLAVNTGVNFFFNLLSTGTEMAVHNILEPEKQSTESFERFGSGVNEEISDTAIDILAFASTTIETVTSDFGGKNIGGPFVGEIASQTLKLGLSYLGSRDREASFSNSYQSPFIDGR